MAVKIFKSGNYIEVIDGTNRVVQTGSANVEIRENVTTANVYDVLVKDVLVGSYPFASIQDENGNAYASVSAFETWSKANSSFNPATAGSVDVVAQDLATHEANTSNPHSVTKTQIGLGNVPNTDCTTTANISDSTNKRFITDAQQTALSNVSGTNTGDQTSIVGISGTKAQFNTALSDDDFNFKSENGSFRGTGTSAQRRAVTSLVTGDRYFDTDLERFMWYDGTHWIGAGIIKAINKSGVDQTANNWHSFVWDGTNAFGVQRTTTVSNVEFAGLLVDGAVNNGTMTLVTTGRAKAISGGTTAIGNYLETGATAGSLVNSGGTGSGVVAKCMTASTVGQTIDVHLFNHEIF